MAARRKTAKKRTTKKAVENSYLVLTSSCGSRDQMAFSSEHATEAAANKAAESVMAEPDSYGGYESESALVVKVLRTGKRSGVTWQ